MPQSKEVRPMSCTKALLMVGAVALLASCADSSSPPRWKASRPPKHAQSYANGEAEQLLGNCKRLVPPQVKLLPRAIVESEVCPCTVWLFQDLVPRERLEALDPFTTDVIAKLSLVACTSMLGIPVSP